MTGLQAMMAYWERLHPVNAVQLVELSRPCEHRELQAAIDRLFGKFLAAGHNLGWPTLSRHMGSRCAPWPRVSVQVDDVPGSPDHPLEDLVTRLLNQPFADDEPPFRVGLATRPQGHYLWLAYRHCIADGRSIALLTQNLLEELAGDLPDDLPLGIDRTSLPLAALLPDESRRAGGLGSVRTSAATMWALHRCHRGRPTVADDFSMSFQVHAERMPIEPIHRRAVEYDATIGELIVAAMLEWFLDQDRRRPRRRWAPNRCVSVIVDLARRAGPRHAALFGQYISPANIHADADRVRDFSDVLRLVRRETRVHTAPVENLRRLRGLALNAFVAGMVPRAVAIGMQDYLFPVSGTVSNVNLAAVLPHPRTPLPATAYVRAARARHNSRR